MFKKVADLYRVKAYHKIGFSQHVGNQTMMLVGNNAHNTRYLVLTGIILSFIATLWVDHIGEEGVYTISTLEMMHTGKWDYPLLLGTSYDRPAMFNWLIASVSYLSFNTLEVLTSARIVTFLATLVSAWVVCRLAKLIFKSEDAAIFSLFAYLGGDVLFRRGWLAYADPVFACFILLSIYMLWLWVTDKKPILLLASYFILVLALLSKTYTAVLFYGAVIAYFVCTKEHRKKFLSSQFVLISAAFAVALYLCKGLIVGGQGGTSSNFIYNVTQSLQGVSLSTYIAKLITFPMISISLLFPLSFICVYLLIKSKDITNNIKPILPCAFILFLSILPYWIVPSSIKARYILPAMPWLAMCIGYIVSLSAQRQKEIASLLIVLTVLLKLIATPWFYYQQTNNKGSSRVAAADILKSIDNNHRVYFNNTTAKELRVAAALDPLLLDNGYPLVESISLRDSDSYYLVSSDKISEGKILSSYHIEGEDLHLQCINNACQSHTNY